MQRGLPVSIFIHVLATVMIFVFGSRVNTPPIIMPNTLDLEFTMVTLPEVKTVEEQKPEPEPEVQQPTIEPEIEVEPMVVPEKPKDIPEEKEPEKIIEPEKEPAKLIPDPVVDKPAVVVEKEPDLPIPAVTGFGVSGTDVDFPFAYYLSIVKTRISRHFEPNRPDFRNNAVISCVLHFNISRSGSISQITVEKSSGIDVFDRAARRAVLSANPLPKLPPKYSSSSLGITFVFNLESGL
jgi:TonB family protein